ncbi:MAG: hypothetical protein S4CHLAM6_01600 [Chlamydiae bacterium]|nr:hypothetical protein [Chlamydiota bacterium]
MCSFMPGWDVQVPGCSELYGMSDVCGSYGLSRAVRPGQVRATRDLMSETWDQAPPLVRTAVVTTAVGTGAYFLGSTLPWGSETAAPLTAFGRVAQMSSTELEPHTAFSRVAALEFPEVDSAPTYSPGSLSGAGAGLATTLSFFRHANSSVYEDGTSAAYRFRSKRWGRIEQTSHLYRMFAGDKDVRIFNPLDPSAPKSEIQRLHDEGQITDQERGLMLECVYEPSLEAIEKGEYPFGTSVWALGPKEDHTHTFQLGSVAGVFTDTDSEIRSKACLIGDLKTEVGQEVCDAFDVADCDIPDELISEYAARLLVEASATVSAGERTWEDYLEGIDLSEEMIGEFVHDEVLKYSDGEAVWSNYLKQAKAELENPEGGAATLQKEIAASDVLVDVAVKLGMPPGCSNVTNFLKRESKFMKAISANEEGIVPDPALQEIFATISEFGF